MTQMRLPSDYSRRQGKGENGERERSTSMVWMNEHPWLHMIERALVLVFLWEIDNVSCVRVVREECGRWVEVREADLLPIFLEPLVVLCLMM